MRPPGWPAALLSCLLLRLDIVQAALDLSGNHVTGPLKKNDPSPLGDPSTYVPERHDCPLSCVDYGNTHSWIPYQSVQRLSRCDKPMLLQLSVNQPVLNDDSPNLIRACSLDATPMAALKALRTPVRNPKKQEDLFDGPLTTAPACVSQSASKGIDSLAVSFKQAKTAAGGGKNTTALLKGMKKFFDNADNCDEQFIFAYHGKTVASVYVGKDLAKSSASSALDAFATFLEGSNSPLASELTAEVCGKASRAGQIIGIAVDAEGDLAKVQKTALAWSKGACASGLSPHAVVPNVEIAHLHGFNITSHNGTTFNTTATHRPSLKRRGQPQKRDDGVCATHLIVNGDTCGDLARDNGMSVDDLENWNKNTWGWTDCDHILLGYNMCLSEGAQPMPPTQEGTECGPLVPGTQRPAGGFADPHDIAKLNPCPLKACCSNWGFCGVLPQHCQVYSQPDDPPGSKPQNVSNTCVSNCERNFRPNPTTNLARIGYYEEFGMDRDCLILQAKNANTDNYTHIHWAFAEIDSSTWKPVIVDKHNQWNDFKNLAGVKKIVSFGGWAYSTEPATYNIIRSAIIDNRDTFSSNIVQFLNDEGIDGVDIDWEYPGAPDIYANGVPIGQKGDGGAYLKFLTVLKSKLGSSKTLSIAAPASYWYLKAFPIDRISSVVDYIVYMTYDLHGQWDHGHPNSFEACPSGTCIRSHVNLTETTYAYSMIGNAGVTLSKVMLGVASYGRSFHMAVPGCWGPDCSFTGTDTQSDAKPGRCTKTGGYLANAEINELIFQSDYVYTTFDNTSFSDIAIIGGDVISYMTPDTKETRRRIAATWGLGGSVDWAIDLQGFTQDDENAGDDRPKEGGGCISGTDLTVNTSDLCEFTCAMGFCPETLCVCEETDPSALSTLPDEVSVDVEALDPMSVDAARLCKFACKYGYCPEDSCVKVPPPDPPGLSIDPNNYFNYTDARRQNAENCLIYRTSGENHAAQFQCYDYCKQNLPDENDDGDDSGNIVTFTYGCISWTPAGQPIQWFRAPGDSRDVTQGKCSCDNYILETITTDVIEALPEIAQIGCWLIMSALKEVIQIGLDAFGGAGEAINAGLDAIDTAAQLVSYVYPSDQDPGGAFQWWLSPCGDTSLVPDDIQNVFNILSAAGGQAASTFKKKKVKPNIPKGSGRKGDKGNPLSRQPPRNGNGNPNGVGKPKPKCSVPAGQAFKRVGSGWNTLRSKFCQNDKTQIQDYIVTSLIVPQNAPAKRVTTACNGAQYPQACHHYSSVVDENPSYATLTCPPRAASTKYRLDAPATDVWTDQHDGQGWGLSGTEDKCDRDEYPPGYFNQAGVAFYDKSGKTSEGQLVRYLPRGQNRGAGSHWKRVCFTPHVRSLSDAELKRRIDAVPASKRNSVFHPDKGYLGEGVAIRVDNGNAEFQFTSWGSSANWKGSSLAENTCLQRYKDKTPNDPGWALLTYDPWYNGKQPPWDYSKKYVKGQNGN